MCVFTLAIRCERPPCLLMIIQLTDVAQDTVRWFTSHPSVKDGGIGVVAVSGGAVFAQVMGWKIPQVKTGLSVDFADSKFDL